MEEHVALEKPWGTLTGVWAPHDVRDRIVDVVRGGSKASQISAGRFIAHWDLRPATTEGDIEIILEAARERHPEAKPRIISYNGPQFMTRDFKELIRIAGLTHLRTARPAIRNRRGVWSGPTACIRTV